MASARAQMYIGSAGNTQLRNSKGYGQLNYQFQTWNTWKIDPQGITQPEQVYMIPKLGTHLRAVTCTSDAAQPSCALLVDLLTTEQRAGREASPTSVIAPSEQTPCGQLGIHQMDSSLWAVFSIIHVVYSPCAFTSIYHKYCSQRGIHQFNRSNMPNWPTMLHCMFNTKHCLVNRLIPCSLYLYNLCQIPTSVDVGIRLQCWCNGL